MSWPYTDALRYDIVLILWKHITVVDSRAVTTTAQEDSGRRKTSWQEDGEQLSQLQRST